MKTFKEKKTFIKKVRLLLKNLKILTMLKEMLLLLLVVLQQIKELEKF
tara:strand:- start:1742 stop:1885 length:144 start_codon:yes stop_codon:yes gene_type:complete